MSTYHTQKWIWSTLEGIAAQAPNAIVDGPFGSSLKLEDYIENNNGGVPVLQGKNVTGDHFTWSEVRFVSQEKATELKRSSVRVGDILLVKIGSIGYSAVIDDLRGFNHAIIPANLAKVTPDSLKVDTGFLHHWLKSVEAKWYLQKSASKTAQPALSLSKFKKMPVPVPPLQEQRHIAAILDQAEALRAKRRQALAKLDTLTQSLFLDMFGDPLSNSNRLPTRPLGEIASFVGGGTPSRSVPAYFTGETCWATPKDIRGRYLIDTEEHITDKAIASSATNLVPAGTILIVVKSKVLMRRLPVVIADVNTCFGQDLKGLRLADGWPAQYVAQHIRMSENFLLRLARGANTEGLTIDHLSRLPILVPPRDLRERYATTEVTLRENIERAKQQLGLMERNIRSLQHCAFRGEL